MKREDHRTDGDFSENLPIRSRFPLAGSALLLGFITGVFLAGCGSVMTLVAAAPEDPTAAYGNELTASLGLGSEPESTWDIETDGSTLNLAPEYAEGKRYANVVYATDAYGSSVSGANAGNRIVHPDDYLGDSTDVGKAFTSAVIDDTMSHSATSEPSPVSFW